MEKKKKKEMAWVDSITNSMDMNLKQSEIVEDRAAR